MAKLLMISGDRALAAGKHGAFYNTLQELHKHFDRIDVICPRVSSFGFRASDFSDKVRVHPSPWPLLFQPFWITKKGREIFRHSHFDIITCHDYPPFYNGIGAYFLCLKVHVPYVLEVMHIPGHPRSSGPKERFYKLLTHSFIDNDAKHARAVRVINQKESPDFLTKAGVPEEKLLYIPAMYIDMDVFKPTEAVKEYDLIFVGRLVENKGIELFLNAAHKINAKALVVGSGPLEKKLKAKNSRLKANITFHGYAKDSNEVAQLLNKSRMLVMPSYNEGGPRVVVEAMACGVPVLATPVGMVPDLAQAGAVQAIDWNSDDIAKKAELLLRDVPRYQSMRQKGLELAKQFERKSAIRNYADKLRGLIK